MKRNSLYIGVWLLLCSMVVGHAESAEPMGEWKNWPDSEIHPDKGGVSGVAVDPATGDLLVIGRPYRPLVWKSTDQGKTFVAAKGSLAGLPANSYSLCMDPAGSRLACFFPRGGGGMVTDGGATLTPFGTVIPTGTVPSTSIDVSTVNQLGLDVGVVDWGATGKACLVITHETHGVLVLSTDSGATWKVLGKDFSFPVGIFDPQTLLVGNSKIGLQRSTDGGATWNKVCDLPKTSLANADSANGTSIIVYKGTGYLLTENGLLASQDKGATWKALGTPVNIGSPPNKFLVSGPFFGADENHILLVGMDGVFQTVDRGANWKKVAPYPSTELNFSNRACFAWDPVHHIVYAAHSGSAPRICQLPVLQEPGHKR